MANIFWLCKYTFIVQQWSSKDSSVYYHQRRLSSDMSLTGLVVNIWQYLTGSYQHTTETKRQRAEATNILWYPIHSVEYWLRYIVGQNEIAVAGIGQYSTCKSQYLTGSGMQQALFQSNSQVTKSDPSLQQLVSSNTSHPSLNMDVVFWNPLESRKPMDNEIQGGPLIFQRIIWGVL